MPRLSLDNNYRKPRSSISSKIESLELVIYPETGCVDFNLQRMHKKRPDTRKDSRGRFGRGLNAITARNSTKFVTTDGPTDRRTGRPTQRGVELRVCDIKAQKSRKSKKGTDRPIDRLTTNRQNDLPTDEQSGM